MSLTFDLPVDEVQIFLEETEEQLATLDRAIVDLESRSDDVDLLQSIFRAAHTLKGAAGLIQHSRMADLTHALETVLDRLRKGELRVTPVMVDTLLASVDMLRALNDEVGLCHPPLRLMLKNSVIPMRADSTRWRSRSSQTRSPRRHACSS